MDTADKLERITTMARSDRDLAKKLLATRKEKDPLRSFCGICSQLGCELSPMDIIVYGEESYAAMRRSTNGGGENSPLLEWEDDWYELFMAQLERMCGKQV